MSATPIQVGIVGGGAVAHALAASLGAARHDGEGSGYKLKVWARRSKAAASVVSASRGRAQAAEHLADLSDCEVLLVAVTDSAVESLAAQLGAQLEVHGPGGRAVFHTGGARTGADALAELGSVATALGSLHPLVAVAPDTAPDPGVFTSRPFMVEATSARAVELGQGLVRAMGGFQVQLPEAATPEEASRHKARYHALATMVATGVVTLVDQAAGSMGALDPEARAEFRRAYGALAESAVRNVLRDGGANVLTGAIARGDERLVARHRAALEGDASASLYQSIEAAARAMLAAHDSTPNGDEPTSR